MILSCDAINENATYWDSVPWHLWWVQMLNWMLRFKVIIWILNASCFTSSIRSNQLSVSFICLLREAVLKNDDFTTAWLWLNRIKSAIVSAKIPSLGSVCFWFRRASWMLTVLVATGLIVSLCFIIVRERTAVWLCNDWWRRANDWACVPLVRWTEHRLIHSHHWILTLRCRAVLLMRLHTFFDQSICVLSLPVLAFLSNWVSCPSV